MKSLILLWIKVANEMATWCCTSATRDCKTVTCRSQNEGLSFLTITLPSFGKDFERSLDRGRVDSDLFLSFSKSGGLPKFLSGFLSRVFDRSSGELLDEPDIDAILAIRQLTLMFGKVLLPCSDARERGAMSDYIECEQEMKRRDPFGSQQNIDDFRRVSSLLFAGVLSRTDSNIYHGRVLPKHGPGATADGLSGNAKYQLRTWTDRLEEIFPAGEFLLPNWSFIDQYDDIHHLDPGAEQPVRVISVPKTQKTPRIIAIEPTAMQYAQQAVQEDLRDSISKYSYLDSMIGFDNQVPNQDMAREGSRDGTLATLDLSEASDRVSNQHVREMMRNHPYLHKAIDASRSRKADVPGHGVVRLAKFASMGSALTFPLEAMVFTTLVFVGIERELNSPLSLRTVKQFEGRVRIYGDDIIIPVEFVRSVVDVLHTFGYVVNTGKSFWNGKFRESCGKEYYDDHDVSIVKVRRMFPTQRRHVQEIISLVSLRNQLFKAGLWDTSRWLDQYIIRLIKHYPAVTDSSPVLGRFHYSGYETQRIGERLHNPLVKGYVVSSKSPKDPLDDSGALLKYFLKRGDQPFADEEHLRRAGRPHAVNIKLRWASPF